MSESPTRPQALIYCRVSTRSQEEDGTSLGTQEAACRKRAGELGYQVASVYREAYSGAEIFDRPQLNLLRDAVRSKQYGAEVVYAVDRLTRAQGLTAYLLTEFDRAGVELVSVTDPLENSLEGKLILGIKEYLAEAEREKIRERTMRGKRARLESGKLQRYGPDLYGYRRDHEAGKRLIHEPEAEIVRSIFRMVVEEGLSVRATTFRLDGRGIAAPSVGRTDYGRTPAWGFRSVHRILTEPAYKGETFAWRQGRDPSAWIALPEGTTPPIVSPTVWDAAQRRLEANKGGAIRHAESRHLLSRIIYCAVCGRRMTADIEQRTTRVYRCTARNAPAGRGKCTAQRVPAEDTVSTAARPRDAAGRLLALDPEAQAVLADTPGVDSWVWERVSSVLRDPGLIAADLRRQQEEGPDPGPRRDLTAAQEALAKTERQQQRLVRLYAESDEELPLQAVKLQMAATEREKAQWQERIAELQRRVREQHQAVIRLDALTTYVERVAHNLASFGFAEKRLALEALGVKVFADGRQWRIEARIPIDAPNIGSASTVC